MLLKGTGAMELFASVEEEGSGAAVFHTFASFVV
jgi:hypothetical protein